MAAAGALFVVLIRYGRSTLEKEVRTGNFTYVPLD
jgi:hypothetical protein